MTYITCGPKFMDYKVPWSVICIISQTGVQLLETGIFGGEGTEDSDEVPLAQVARKKEQARRRNLELVERCHKETAKIVKSGSWREWLQQPIPPSNPQNSLRWRNSLQGDRATGKAERETSLLAGDQGIDGDQAVPKVSWVLDSKVAIPEACQRNCTRFQDGSLLHIWCHFHIAGS